jgi:drug/metabolite transporter (DMT)-like permease
MGYLAAFGTLLSWTIATYAFAFATRKAPPASINRVRLLYAAIALSIFCCLFFGLNPIALFSNISGEQYLWFGISGFIGLTLGDYFAFSAFKILGNRRTSLFSCFAPSAAFLGASLLLNEPITLQGIGGMLLSVAGILLLILSRAEKQSVALEGHGSFAKGVVFGILGAVGQGVGLVFAKKGFEVSPQNFNPIYATWVRMLIASITVYAIGAFKVNLWKEFKEITFHKEIQKQVALGTLFGPMVGISLSLYAATHLEAGVAQTIFSMLPITVLLAAVIWFKEKINLLSYLAVAISLAGVLILVWR